MQDKIVEEFAFLSFTNIFGTNLGKLIPLSRLKNIENNPVSFACIRADGLGVNPNQEDLTVEPCMENAVELLFDNCKILWVPCCLHKKNRQHSFCPRTILDKIIKSLNDLGVEIEVGFEPEFYLLGDDLRSSVHNEPQIPAFNLQGTLSAYDYLKTLDGILSKANIEATSIVHEGGRGQFEFGLKHGEPLLQTDRLVAFKIIAKELARKQGMIASFMPKPFDYDFGSSTQINISIKNGSKSLIMSAIAGILKHARAITAFTCPTTNSYKRLTLSSNAIKITWAPTKINYGIDNRSTLIRLVSRDQRIEYRASDFSGNMYLSVAAVLAGAYDGIKNKLMVPEAVSGDLYSECDKYAGENLPNTLLHALEALSADPFLLEFMGEEFCSDYISLKTQECMQEFLTVSDEERTRYIDV